ncbi:uncharacterized protein LOC118205557 isoform X2 [Stegodyphus dumicola]|uniref:uncharacterized protein LOC118205557 isoform X2 n=1 Tax=Stegodyphus dumicola TaxID=202533 RepID=UPI0015A7BA27|nr:uncharacterized protein LOC118205557 isoform X2 [Stegodyphus dumicola]
MACNSREEQNELRDIDANCSKSENSCNNISENSRSVDFMSELENEISNFYNEVHKILKAKRRSLEEFTKETICRGAERVSEEYQNIHDEKRKLVYRFRRNFFSLITEYEVEEKKLKKFNKSHKDVNNLEEDHLKIYHKIYDELQYEFTCIEEGIRLRMFSDECAEAH